LTRYAHGTLKNLAADDLSTSLEETQRYLLARHEALGCVPPRVVEETVASVFRSAGWSTRLTAQSWDDGIDIYVLSRTDGVQTGVQVKRMKKKVSVDQIRSFLGAIVAKRIRQGVFVATTGYTSAARKFANQLKEMGIARIDLKNGQWLVEELQIAMRPCYKSWNDPDAPFAPLLGDAAQMPVVNADWIH
jgi:restriction system protein